MSQPLNRYKADLRDIKFLLWEQFKLEDLLGNMAKYHAACWEDPDLAILKTPNDFYRNLSTFVRMGPRTAVGMERAHSVVPGTLYGRAADLFGFLADGLDVRVHQRYPLAEAARAQADLESRATTGKLLLIP